MGELGGLESKDLGSWGAVRGMEEPGGVVSDLCRRCVGCVRLCLISSALSDLCRIRVGFAKFM